MRLDLMTVFPEYFDVLRLALLGKARQDGVIDVYVHDLREFTHDRHRTVDDAARAHACGRAPDPETGRSLVT